jgi:hypothetical protein
MGRCFLNTETQRWEVTEEDQIFWRGGVGEFFKHRDTETRRKTRFFGERGGEFFKHRDTEIQRHREERSQRERWFFEREEFGR